MAHDSIVKHHREELSIKTLLIAPAFYYRLTHGVLTGLSSAYIYDLRWYGNPKFQRISEPTRQKFEMKSDELLPTEFTGFIVGTLYDGSFYIDQSHYLRKLECLPLDASFSQFISMRMRLDWFANSRPECLLEISQLAQVNEEMYEKERE